MLSKHESADSFRRLVHFVCTLLAHRVGRVDSVPICLALVPAIATCRHHDERGICADSDITLFAGPFARMAKIGVPRLSDAA